SVMWRPTTSRVAGGGSGTDSGSGTGAGDTAFGASVMGFVSTVTGGPPQAATVVTIEHRKITPHSRDIMARILCGLVPASELAREACRFRECVLTMIAMIDELGIAV